MTLRRRLPKACTKSGICHLEGLYCVKPLQCCPVNHIYVGHCMPRRMQSDGLKLRCRRHQLDCWAPDASSDQPTCRSDVVQSHRLRMSVGALPVDCALFPSIRRYRDVPRLPEKIHLGSGSGIALRYLGNPVQM